VHFSVWILNYIHMTHIYELHSSYDFWPLCPPPPIGDLHVLKPVTYNPVPRIWIKGGHYWPQHVVKNELAWSRTQYVWKLNLFDRNLSIKDNVIVGLEPSWYNLWTRIYHKFWTKDWNRSVTTNYGKCSVTEVTSVRICQHSK
jgi:hypothetical protein